jgi:hypothetical protein
LVKLGGTAFENDLLFVRAPEGQPAETDARQDDGEEEYPDAPFHETRRRLSRCPADWYQFTICFLKIAQRFNAGKIMG